MGANISVNSGPGGVGTLTAPVSVSVTLTDVGGQSPPPTNWSWTITRWPAPLAVPPAITGASTASASFTPALDGMYQVELLRTEFDGSTTTRDAVIVGVPNTGGFVLPSPGIDEHLFAQFGSVSTTVAAGSNGVDISTFTGSGTLHVASTTGFASQGELDVPALGAVLSYTGTSGGNSFTGVDLVSGSGVLATSQAVNASAGQAQAARLAGWTGSAAGGTDTLLDAVLRSLLSGGGGGGGSPYAVYQEGGTADPAHGRYTSFGAAQAALLPFQASNPILVVDPTHGTPVVNGGPYDLNRFTILGFNDEEEEVGLTWNDGSSFTFTEALILDSIFFEWNNTTAPTCTMTSTSFPTLSLRNSASIFDNTGTQPFIEVSSFLYVEVFGDGGLFGTTTSPVLSVDSGKEAQIFLRGDAFILGSNTVTGAGTIDVYVRNGAAEYSTTQTGAASILFFPFWGGDLATNGTGSQEVVGLQNVPLSMALLLPGTDGRVVTYDASVPEFVARSTYNTDNVNWTQAAWFVDPSNVSGLASDANDGLTSITPLFHFAEIYRRWGTLAPLLPQSTTVTLMSDQVDATDPPMFDDVRCNGFVSTTVASGSNGVLLTSFAGTQSLHAQSTAGFPPSGELVFPGHGGAIVRYAGISGNDFTNCTWEQGTGTLSTGDLIRPSPDITFSFVGTPLSVGTGSLGTVTAKNRSAAQPYQVAGLAAIGGRPTLFHDTATDVWFWITHKTNTVTEPIRLTFGLLGAPISTSDAYVAYRLPRVYMPSFRMKPMLSDDNDGASTFQSLPVLAYLEIHALTAGTGASICEVGNANITNCAFMCGVRVTDSTVWGAQLDAQNTRTNFINCDLCIPTTGTGSIPFSTRAVLSGGYVNGGFGVFTITGPAMLDQDVLVYDMIDIRGPLTIGYAYFDQEVNVGSTDAFNNGVGVGASIAVFDPGAIWGPCTEEFGVGLINVCPGGDLVVQGNFASVILAGGTSPSLHRLTLDGQTVAASFNVTTGAWVGNIDLTPAHLDASLGSGGFGGYAHGALGSRIRKGL